MKLHPDFSDLLVEFARENVRYVLLGGYAVGFHSEPRATKDLDLLVSPSQENRERVQMALARFGAPANLVHAAGSLKDSEILFLGQAPVRIDILTRADGIETESAIDRAIEGSIDGIAIRIIRLDDLIANKVASGRPQDLADVQRLKAFSEN